MGDQLEMLPGTNRDVTRSQWFTPPRLAERVVKWAGPPISPFKPWRVLEPSAGNGALVRPLVAAGAEVMAVELDGRYNDDLRRSGAAWHWLEQDFLKLDCAAFNPFDLCVMNPPYEQNQDVRFIQHALLFAPRVVAILRADIWYTLQRFETLWKSVRPTRAAFCVRRPFKGAETDFCVLELVTRTDSSADSPLFSVEWWEDKWF